MDKKITVYLMALMLLLAAGCNAPKSRSFKIEFNPDKEVSGKKFAIADITPGLPSNWDDFNYVVLEFKITTAQRFHIGFTTNSGYNELRIMSYVPNGWNKLAIPLKFYRDLPDANIDLAATFNQPRYTGWINLGGHRGPLQGVDSIGIRMRAPIGRPGFEIRSIALSVDDPGDEYLETTPSVDQFGQWALGDYEGKIHSLEQLQQEWKIEENEHAAADLFNYSKYGGYLQKQVVATGFFRTELIDGRWWFVDPEGYLFLSVGVDCISSGRGGNAKDVDKRRNMFGELPPQELLTSRAVENRNNRQGRQNDYNYGLWNLYRRYGENFRQKANEMIITRMDKWGINTIGNWSGQEIITMNKKAFMITLRTSGMERGLMGLADVYAPGFREKLEENMKGFLQSYKDNPWLIGYFVGNEPSWLEQEARLCDIILTGPERPIKTELKKFMEKEDTPELRKQFVYDTFRKFLAMVKETQLKYDPHHMNLGIRFGNISNIDEDLLKICKESFDVLSFNCYDLVPGKEMMDRALSITGLPMIIGEYHFGTVDRGMAQSLWQVDSQEERGVAYRYYTENGYAHPGLIGTAYFQWSDQDLTGRRNDGENYNCGVVDVTDRPYPFQVNAMVETAKVLYDIHSGVAEPFNRKPVRPRGHGSIPNMWDN